MSWRNTLTQVREEMEKDGLDLMEQVIILTMGGILGGQAFQITQSDYPLSVEMVLYFFILFLGLCILGLVHLVVSYNRVLQRKHK